MGSRGLLQGVLAVGLVLYAALGNWRAMGGPSVPATSSAARADEAGALDTASQVERGRYLARAGDCESCHTAPGGKPYAGGRAIATGFGTVVAPNITPDRETGIGGWSADTFYRAMHEGLDDEGHHLYPAFPYPWFTRVTRADVLAIKAYLDTVPAVRQEDQPPHLAWWATRPLLGAWNAINFDAGEYKADPRRSAAWNRGAYLVEGLGHCSACHGAKGPLGGVHEHRPFEGSRTPDGWYAPSLGGSTREGLGRWSVDDIVEYLKTGSNARTAPAGEMREVVEDSTRWLTDADLHAVAVYLKSLPPSNQRDADVPALDGARLQRGEALFTDQCTGCHMRDGGGVPGVFPALAGSSAVQASDPSTLLRVVLDGARIPATQAKPTALAMPAFGWKLDDAEVADVVSYIRSAWGNRAPAVNAAAVADARAHTDREARSR
ncbi:MAG TPA: c-type cytochrome [Caldimonas sp.]|nr:c-type cytochrome [Caldimonas sp.]